eukprot:SAG31_NODE_34515_length_332_cov_0.789700_1_plen_57_part_01
MSIVRMPEISRISRPRRASIRFEHELYAEGFKRFRDGKPLRRGKRGCRAAAGGFGRL